jgi:hypothetical protein
MGYTKLFELLKDETKLTSLITNLSSGFIEVPYLISETLKLLADDSIYYNAISDNNKISLCIMIDNYFSDCLEQYIADINLDKLLKFGKIEVYKIEAADGLRYATQGEVANGVKGLIGEYIYTAGEEEYKNLCLLQWSFSGIGYFYKQAGYNLKYDDKGKVLTSFYEMITQSAYGLKNLFDWISVKSNFETAIAKIKKMQKKHGYKYATYAKDEVTEEITIKQLVYNIYRVFPRNSTNYEYRRALALALKNYKNKKPLTPSEVSWLREVYEKHAVDINKEVISAGENKEIKDKCEKLLAERYSGRINQNHFAYNIIETLKKYNYSKCTDKQMDIINKAYYIIGEQPISKSNDEDNNSNKTEIISDNDIEMSLADMSDALFAMEEEDE